MTHTKKGEQFVIWIYVKWQFFKSLFLKVEFKKLQKMLHVEVLFGCVAKNYLICKPKFFRQ